MENSCYKLFNLNFDNFSELINKYEPDIDQEHLFIIYNLIQNNRYALDDSHYNDVLYNYITKRQVLLLVLKLNLFLQII